MNNLMKKFELAETGNFRYRFPVPSFAVETQVLEHPDAKQDTRWRVEYRMELRLGVTFRCPPAALDLAKKDAETLLIRHLYSDVLEGLARIRRSAHAGDFQGIIKQTRELEKELTT